MEHQYPFELQTRAEATDFRETSRYVDILTFGTHLSRKTESMRVEKFGRTEEGREMLLWIFSNRTLFDPASAKAYGKPVVLIINNIHAGEVCGKEASQILARELTLGSLKHLLDDMVVLIVPMFNVDGNERIDKNNRKLDLEKLEGQYNPEDGVGIRQTAKGYDLNRDYIKQEAVEMRNLQMGVYYRWRPHLNIDCHATDGSIHSYHLTYAEPQNPAGAFGPIEHVRSQLLPSVTKALESRTGYRTFFYGNFRNAKDPAKGWETYPHLPRFGSHYRGLTGRMDILSETYSYLSYRDRIRVNYEFLVEVLTYTAQHGRDMVRIVDEAERETVRRGEHPGDRVGISFRMDAWEKPVEILTNQEIDTDASGRVVRTRFGETMRRYTTKHYANFVPTQTVARPYAYVIPADLTDVVARLGGHNVRIEKMKEPAEIEMETYLVKKIVRAGVSGPDYYRQSQGRPTTTLEVEKRSGKRTVKAGDYLVRLAQPQGNLIVYLLEPESDDSLVTWNFFDAHLTEGKDFPVLRVPSPVKIISEPVQPQ